MILRACIIMTYEKGQRRMALSEPLAGITGDGEIDHLEYTGQDSLHPEPINRHDIRNDYF